MAPQITHLTFDFFGTLVEYKPGHFSGNKKYILSFSLLQKNKYPFDYKQFENDYAAVFNELTKQSLGTFQEFPMDKVTEIFLQRNNLLLPKSTMDSFTKIYLDEWNANVVYYPEIQKFMNQLNKKYSLSIISNTHYSPLVVNNLNNMKILNAFEMIVTSVDHGQLKPHPSIFTDTLKALNASPDKTVHIGDSYNDDFIGAQNAGIRCILIDPEAKYEEKVTDRVNSLFDVDSYLKSQAFIK